MYVHVDDHDVVARTSEGVALKRRTYGLTRSNVVTEMAYLEAK